MDYFIYLIIVGILFASANMIVHSTYSKYNNIRTASEKTGSVVVEEMQRKHDLYNLRIEKIPGNLSDHYDSKGKVIRLSKSNYERATIAGVAVAAHEMGHAIQDKENYFFLKIRQYLGPITVVANNISWIIIFLGFLIWYLPLVYAGIACFALVVLFDLITLPVELNASKRARRYLASTGEYNDEELIGIRKVLNAAAFTYVASTLAGLLQLVRLIGLARDD